VNLARFRKSKVTCFLSHVDYRPNTNTSNIMGGRKKGHIKGRVKEGSQGEYG
jgi:hypothetical protein